MVVAEDHTEAARLLRLATAHGCAWLSTVYWVPPKVHLLHLAQRSGSGDRSRHAQPVGTQIIAIKRAAYGALKVMRCECDCIGGMIQNLASVVVTAMKMKAFINHRCNQGMQHRGKRSAHQGRTCFEYTFGLMNMLCSLNIYSASSPENRS